MSIFLSKLPVVTAALVIVAGAAAPVIAADLPAAIRLPVPAASPLSVHIDGVQIYVCGRKEGSAGPAWAWKFKSPEGAMTADDGTVAGRHYAGPSWGWQDGSKIVGEIVGRADAPKANAIPWLLLKTKSVGGAGRLADIAYVQRLETEGGVAPADGCTAASEGVENRVPYRAHYLFYALSPSVQTGY